MRTKLLTVIRSLESFVYMLKCGAEKLSAPAWVMWALLTTHLALLHTVVLVNTWGTHRGPRRESEGPSQRRSKKRPRSHQPVKRKRVRRLRRTGKPPVRARRRKRPPGRLR